MYAVFQIGNRQYRVIQGQFIHIERVNYDVGDNIEFNEVLLIKDSDGSLKIGYPFITNARIIARVIAHSLCKKVKIVKFRRRKHFRKCQGHRQGFTRIKIENIQNIM